jgi:hypothetical protein
MGAAEMPDICEGLPPGYRAEANDGNGRARRIGAAVASSVGGDLGRQVDTGKAK